jgi:hypothetical protein
LTEPLPATKRERKEKEKGKGESHYCCVSWGGFGANSDNNENALLLYYPFLIPSVDLSIVNPFLRVCTEFIFRKK